MARSRSNCCSGKAISTTYCKCACSLSYPACSAHAPYCHLRPVRLYYIFPHYLIHGTIVRRFVNINCVLLFSQLLLFETFLGAFANLRKTTIGFVMSVRLSVCLTLCLFVCPCVCPHTTTKPPLDRSSWNLSIFENLSRKLNFYWSRTRITGILHEDQYTFLTISRSFLLGMRNVSGSLERNSKKI